MINFATNKKLYYKENGQFIELYFDSVPDDKTRDLLKLYKWRWFAKNKCWSNFNNAENIEFVKGLLKTINGLEEDDPIKRLERVVVEPVDVVVRSNGFYCNANHVVLDMAGELAICNHRGEIRIHLVPIAYCANCDTYFIQESVYNDLSKKGIILCQIMKYKTYKEYGKFSLNNRHWRDESPLKIMGYSVGQDVGLSEVQRRIVLEDIVDAGVLTKDQTISYLNFFIRNHANMPSAIDKWESDKKYIENYRIGSSKRVIVQGITIYRRL